MPPIKFSFFVSLIISFAFLLITFWIFYKYSWSAEAAKDALNTTGSYFGAAATLGAAVIAAYLFNDWRDSADYSTKKEQIVSVLGVMAQLRYQLINMQEAFLTFKKSKDFLIMNSSLLNYDDQDSNKKIFEIIPNIKFLRNSKIFLKYKGTSHILKHSFFFAKRGMLNITKLSPCIQN